MIRKLMPFMMKDIFEIYSPKKRFNANAIKFGGKYPYVARGSSNNGVRGYITEDEQYLSPAKSLSFGQDTATVFYQSSPYFTGDKIKIMDLRNHELNDKLAQYFIAVIKKVFSSFAWGQSSFNEKILKDMKIALPVIESADPDHEYTIDDIDWKYMQERIAELEQERIAELEAYLTASGLNDFELTDEDKETLSLESVLTEENTLDADNQNGQIKLTKYALGDLFEASTGDVDLQQKDLNGKGEYFVNSGVDNRGIKGRTDKAARIFPSNTITIDFLGNVYYRDFEYKMATHNHVFSLKGDVIKNKYVGIYIVGLLHRLPLLFSYHNMATWNKLKSLEISLPVNQQGDIDFDYMTRYIRAIEKLAIKDVVTYKDKVISTTREITSK